MQSIEFRKHGLGDFAATIELEILNESLESYRKQIDGYYKPVLEIKMKDYFSELFLIEYFKELGQPANTDKLTKVREEIEEEIKRIESIEDYQNLILRVKLLEKREQNIHSSNFYMNV